MKTVDDCTLCHPPARLVAAMDDILGHEPEPLGFAAELHRWLVETMASTTTYNIAVDRTTLHLLVLAAELLATSRRPPDRKVKS